MARLKKKPDTVYKTEDSMFSFITRKGLQVFVITHRVQRRKLYNTKAHPMTVGMEQGTGTIAWASM